MTAYPRLIVVAGGETSQGKVLVEGGHIGVIETTGRGRVTT
jgi:hypothetical protein